MAATYAHISVSSIYNESTRYSINVSINISLISKYMIKIFFLSADYNLYLLSKAGLSYSTTPTYTVTIECWDNFGSTTSDVVVFIIPNSPPTFTNLPGIKECSRFIVLFYTVFF